MRHVVKLEESELWQKAVAIALDAYETVVQLPKEEEWDMKTRLHQHAFALTDSVAEAYGSLDPRDSKWLLGKARGNLFAIKSALTLGYKAGELPEKSEVMVHLQEAVKLLEVEVKGLDADIQQWYEALRDKTGQGQ